MTHPLRLGTYRYAFGVFVGSVVPQSGKDIPSTRDSADPELMVEGNRQENMGDQRHVLSGLA